MLENVTLPVICVKNVKVTVSTTELYDIPVQSCQKENGFKIFTIFFHLSYHIQAITMKIVKAI